MEYISIGNVKIKKTAALAPMAGVADTAFRTIAKEFGAAYVVGEMTSCKGLVYGDLGQGRNSERHGSKSSELLEMTASERPAAVQLFGAEPEFVEAAVPIAERFSPDIIDINCGCPVPKVVSIGAGSALMKDPVLFGKVVGAAVKAAHVPVTVKIRSGWDAEHINAVEIARIAEECGAAAVAVHARTKTLMYSGRADRELIAEVKQAVSIPVIGNGDIDSVESCISMYEQTGCDLVMIARGAYGNPWLFRDIDDHFSGREKRREPELSERLEVMRRHIELLVKCKGEKVGMKEARMQTSLYLKGIPNAAKYRGLCGKLTAPGDLDGLIRLISEENETQKGTNV